MQVPTYDPRVAHRLIDSAYSNGARMAWAEAEIARLRRQLEEAQAARDEAMERARRADDRFKLVLFWTAMIAGMVAGCWFGRNTTGGVN